MQTGQDEPFLQQTSTKWNKDQFHPSKTQRDVPYAVVKRSKGAEGKCVPVFWLENSVAHHKNS